MWVFRQSDGRAKRSSALRTEGFELARYTGSSKSGSKLRFSDLFWHVLARCPVKVDYFHKDTKQFGLARRSGTFSKDRECEARRDFDQL